MSNGHHHFISYSSVDSLDFALKLHDALEAGPPHIPAWLDKRDLKPGKDWDDQLNEAIRDCDGLIFAMTRDSVEPQSMCKREWARAFSYKKPVVPLLLHRDVEVPFRLEDRQYIDFTGNFDQGMAKLRSYLAWLKTPEGILQALEDRLADAKRALRRADDPSARGRIEDEMILLDKQIAEQKVYIENPEAAKQRTAESIERGLERERQPEKPVGGQVKSKFINPPPAVAPTYFQDRVIESGLIGDFLKDLALRLAVVVGRGGIGKTALVCRLLKSLENGKLPDTDESLPIDGIVYERAETSGQMTYRLYSDLCKLLPEDTAKELDALYKDPQASTEAKMKALLARFPQGRTVVLLDNFEDVVDPGTQEIKDKELDECLRALLKLPVHGVKVIITTRVAPRDLLLAPPTGRQMKIELDAGLESPFAENVLRAMDRDGKLGLKGADPEILGLARERTLGYPRALEALVMALSADKDTTLDEMLTVAEKYLPENVTHALVGEAFSRLDVPSQRVMQALAIYHRPVTPTAVDYLLQPYVPGINSGPVLSRLVNMHFVRRDAGRYYLHPVDQDYALSLIPRGSKSDRFEAGEPLFTQFALRDRGAAYFKQTRKPRKDWKTIDDLAPQLAEFDLRCEGEDYDTAADLLTDIDFDYLLLWGFYRLMADMHERLQGKIEARELQRISVGKLGLAYYSMGQVQQAIVYEEQALDIAREMNNRHSESAWLGNLGNCYGNLGQTVRAAEYHEQALVIDREIGDRKGESIDLGNLGSCYGILGQTAQAITHYEQALAIAREVGDREGEGRHLGNLAEVLTNAGRFSEAIRNAQEGIKIGEEIASLGHGSYNNAYLAQAYFYSGNLIAARQAAETARKYDEPLNNHTALALLGVITLRQVDQVAAHEAFTAAVNHAGVMLERNPQNYDALDAKGIALCGLALCENQPERMSDAIKAFRAARAITTAAGLVGRVGRLFDALAVADSVGMLAPVRAVLAEYQ